MQRAVVDHVLRPAESAFWGALDRASSWMARVEGWMSEVRRMPWGAVDLMRDHARPVAGTSVGAPPR